MAGCTMALDWLFLPGQGLPRFIQADLEGGQQLSILSNLIKMVSYAWAVSANVECSRDRDTESMYAALLCLQDHLAMFLPDGESVRHTY